MIGSSFCVYRRQWIQFDEKLGYRFVPNLYARIFRQNHTFVIQTNEQGFRSSESFNRLDPELPTVLAIGDSYVAGDGVSNEERFTDILSNELGFNLMNAGLPAAGVDQQLLIQEYISKYWKYDILLFAPFCHDFNRNLLPKTRIVDHAAQEEIEFSKPYFSFDRDATELKINNTHVNCTSICKTELSYDRVAKLKMVARSGVPAISALLLTARDSVYKLAYRNKIFKADPFFAEPDSHAWKLMASICRKIVRNADPRPVVIVPIPLGQHVIYNAYPYYIDFFRGLAASNSNVHIVDILPSLQSRPASKRNDLYIPGDGHFSFQGHQVVAQNCTTLLEKLLAKHKTSKHASYNRETPVKKGSGPILGISCFYHDSAAAIITDGQIIAAAQEERFSRLKHDSNFPINAIQYCLEEARITENELGAIVYYDHEGVTLERMFASRLLVGKDAKKGWERNLLRWSETKGLIWKYIREEIGYQGPLYRTLHHRAHAASAFYPSPFEEAAILVVDGVGEWATTTIALGKSSGITLLREIRFPHSLGLLYSTFTSFCGFRVNSGEYKLMGLAPYGRPVYRDKILNHIVKVEEDGSYSLNLSCFEFLKGDRMFGQQFADLFDGPARIPEAKITKRECNLAASIQSVLEEILVKIAQYISRTTGQQNLVLAGGVALNCVANSQLLQQGIFRDIWVQPAAGDAGGALGAALDFYYQQEGNGHKKSRTTDQLDSCFGPSFAPEEIRAFLDLNNLPYTVVSGNNRAASMAQFLAQGAILGHFCGRMEFGPRALGARSILADPRPPNMQENLNLKIKFRESFRPFAPIVKEEKLSRYFATDHPSPYMMFVAPVVEKARIGGDIPSGDERDILEQLKQVRSEIPAVTHVDYSSRIQSVSRERYPKLYEILDAFEQVTGCSVLVNTSFNVRGEPIVCTPADAYRCFMRSGIDVLVLEDFILMKSEQPNWSDRIDWRLDYVLD